GPARSLRRVEGALDWAAFVGDETTIGAAEALLGALSPGVKRFGALEVHPESVDAVAARSLGTATLPREERGAAMLRWAEAMPIPLGEGVVWLSGEASSLVPVKRALLERGLPRRMLRVKPYWSVKGKAHRKALERGALR
ncbi:MAG: SIP domain-containing protein, partial [Myxococcota bacterium]